MQHLEISKYSKFISSPDLSFVHNTKKLHVKQKIAVSWHKTLTLLDKISKLVTIFDKNRKIIEPLNRENL